MFSPWGDALAFGAPIVAAVGIVAWAASNGALHADLPPWLFVVLVVACDVGHVWSTVFRTYLDPEERARRPGLLAGVPIVCFGVGFALHAAEPDGRLFWRVLAYVAAFHFVRQQWGWMAYAGRRAGERARLDVHLDRAAIYAATVFPLLWWHAHLPRQFDWFVAGDFVGGLPRGAADVAHVLHFVILGVWCARQAWLFATRRGANLAKALVLGTTWIAWYGGIVVLDSDVAFTATNVLAHGVPYFVLVHRWGGARWAGTGAGWGWLFRPRAWIAFVGVLAAVAYVEEAAWDRLVWHDHATLFPFGALRVPGAVLDVVVPLLALPQATHYVLDAFLWRTGASNPGLRERLGLT